MAQITNLLNLSPQLQESLLLGDLHLSERRIRALVARGRARLVGEQRSTDTSETLIIETSAREKRTETEGIPHV